MLEDGVAVDVAGVVGVGLPPVESGVAEVWVIVERDGGVDDVADGFEGAVFEVEHAIDAGGEGRGEAHFAVCTEAAHGVDDDGVVDSVEVFAYGAPVPALVVGDGVGPVEVFENFDGEAEGDGVLKAVLHAVEGGEFKEVGVLGGDVVVGRHGVGEGDVFVPAVGTGDLFAAQGVEGGGAEGEGGQFDVHKAGLGIVGLAQRGGKVDGAAQLCGVGDAGGGGAVEVVVAVGGVFVVVAALQIDVGREAAMGVGLGILLVFPFYLEVAELLESCAVSRNAFLGDAVADVEVAFVFVAHVVVALGFGRPTEVGVYLADEGEVDVVVDGEVVATVLEVVSPVVHPAVAGHENARRAVVRHGKEGEGEHEGSRYILDGDVGGACEYLVASDELGASEIDGKVGMVVVAGGVLSAVEVHDRVADFLHARAMEESVALLGDDARDETFVGVVVEHDGVGHVFIVALLEEGAAGGFAIGVGYGLCIERLFVEVHSDFVGLEFHSVIFYNTFVVQLSLALVDVDGNGVGGLVVYDAGEGIGGVGDDGHSGAIGCFQ